MTDFDPPTPFSIGFPKNFPPKFGAGSSYAPPRFCLSKFACHSLGMHNEPTQTPEPLPPVAAPVAIEPELSEFDNAYEAAVKALPDNVRLVVERLSFQIKNEGLNLDEACLLCNVDADWLDKQVDVHPIIARIFAKKELEYRTALMGPINKKARVDDKFALTMLERKYPAGRKNAKEAEEESDNMLAQAIKHVQENGDSTVLVRRESGAAVLISKAGSGKRLADRIQNLLPKNFLN